MYMYMYIAGGVTEEIDLRSSDYMTNSTHRHKLFARLHHFVRDGALVAAEIPVR